MSYRCMFLMDLSSACASVRGSASQFVTIYKSFWIDMRTSFTYHRTQQVIRMSALKLLSHKGEPLRAGFILSVTRSLPIGRVHPMATALKYHPGSLIKESHLFPAHVCFELSQPLFDPTVRHFLVPHDIKVLADMKCALLATHTGDGTLTAGFYCPARVRRSYLIEIGNPSKEWVLYHNLNRIGFEDIQVEHGDFFVLYEKVPRKSWSPSLEKVTSEIVPTLQGTFDHRLSSCSSSTSTPACLGLLFPSPTVISNSGDLFFAPRC